MKTIAFAANTSWYLYNFRSSSITTLVRKGYKVVCFCPEDEYSLKLQGLGCEWVSIKINNKGMNPLQDFYLFISLLNNYKRFKPTAVFHFTLKLNIYGTWASCLLANTYSINNISGLGTAFLKNGYINFIVKILYKASQRFAYRIFCQNIDDLNFLIEQGLVPKEKLFLLPGSGVNTKKFHPNLRKNQSQNKIFTFIFIGRMLADKGLFELIEAMKLLNFSKTVCRLVLYGFCDNQNHSSIQANTLKSWNAIPGVSWMGPLENIENILALADCLVLPSYGEGMPKSILEACSMELPVVASDVAGCRNIIKHRKNGLLCKPRDSLSLKNAMKEMLQMSQADRLVMGKNGRQIVKEKFSEDLVINELLETIHDINSGNKI